MRWLLHVKGIHKGPLVLGDNTPDRLLDLLARRPAGNRYAFEDGKLPATQAYVPAMSAIGTGMHASHLLMIQGLQRAVVLDESADLFPVHLAMPGVAQVKSELLLLTGGAGLHRHG